MLTKVKSPSSARQNFFSLMDEVIEDCSVVIVERRDAPNVAILPESELRSLQEAVYLLRSPRNAQRLFDAIEWADHHSDESIQTAQELRDELEQEIEEQED